MTTQDTTIARTILNQLAQSNNGACRLNIMIGAYNFISHDNGVSFRFKSRNQLSANYLKITLNSLDYYNLEFGRVHGSKYTVKLELDNIENNQLKELFEHKTALYLSI